MHINILIITQIHQSLIMSNEATNVLYDIFSQTRHGQYPSSAIYAYNKVYYTHIVYVQEKKVRRKEYIHQFITLFISHN